MQNDIWAVELPHGMPKDSHLLPQHSQDLLRAARSGKIYKRPAPVEEEEVDPEVVPGDKPEKKDDELKDKGFTAKSWKQIPRHLEASDVEYLAKRRKGVITITARGSAPGPTLVKTTVKRTDAVGNEYVQDVVVPQGQHVEGEVIAQTVIPDPNVDASAALATPPKRKGPVSRKKVKGPGRGRKKKPIAPTSVPVTGDADGSNQPVATTEGQVGPDVRSQNVGLLSAMLMLLRESRSRMILALLQFKMKTRKWAMVLMLRPMTTNVMTEMMAKKERMRIIPTATPLHRKQQNLHHPSLLLYQL
jgi:hypothetical protein